MKEILEVLKNPEIPSGAELHVVVNFEDTGRYYNISFGKVSQGFLEFANQEELLRFIHKSGVIEGQLYPEEVIAPEHSFQVFRHPSEKQFVQTALLAMEEIEPFDHLGLMKANLSRIASELSENTESQIPHTNS